MSVRNVQELLEALVAGDFERLMETPEGEWLDFKSQPYQLEKDDQKWELAKDVAAFANVSGGIILLGVKTTKRPTEIGERASSYSFIPRNLVDWNKYLDVVRDWIYPEVRGVQATWYPEDPSQQDGLLLIRIPLQRVDEQPFMLRRMLVRENAPPVTALGIPERRGDRIHWMRAEALHPPLKHFRGGGTPSGSVGSPGQSNERAMRANGRLESIVREMEWTDIPTYFLQAYAPPGTRFGAEFQARDGIRGAIAKPPSLRDIGFNLQQRGELETRDGSLVYLEDSRRAIWLDRDGLLTVGAAGVEDFLGWARNKQRAEGAPLEVNPLVLVEFTLEFFRLVYQALVPRAPGLWTFRSVGEGWKTRAGGLKLRAGRAEQWMYNAMSSNPASGDNFLAEHTGTGSATRDAFTLLTEVYGFFGLEPAAIPYSANGEVSEEQIRNL